MLASVSEPHAHDLGVEFPGVCDPFKTLSLTAGDSFPFAKSNLRTGPGKFNCVPPQFLMSSYIRTYRHAPVDSATITSSYSLGYSLSSEPQFVGPVSVDGSRNLLRIFRGSSPRLSSLLLLYRSKTCFKPDKEGTYQVIVED